MIMSQKTSLYVDLLHAFDELADIYNNQELKQHVKECLDELTEDPDMISE